MQYSIYVLKSLKNNKRYVGYTSKDPFVRLGEHNNLRTPYTRNNTPFILIYFEKGYCIRCVKVRERFLKSGQGRKLLDAIEFMNQGSSPKANKPMA